MNVEVIIKVSEDDSNFETTYNVGASGVSDFEEFLSKTFRSMYFSWLANLPPTIIEKLFKKREEQARPKKKETKKDA